MEYEVLPHTADLRIKATGRTLEELFYNALRGMSSVMQPGALVQPATVSQEISVSAGDTASLLVDFLSEALSLSQINREVYTEVAFNEFTSRWLRATLRGAPVPSLVRDIKAVTYHGVAITETDAGYETTVVYDI